MSLACSAYGAARICSVTLLSRHCLGSGSNCNCMLTKCHNHVKHHVNKQQSPAPQHHAPNLRVLYCLYSARVARMGLRLSASQPFGAWKNQELRFLEPLMNLARACTLCHTLDKTNLVPKLMGRKAKMHPKSLTHKSRAWGTGVLSQTMRFPCLHSSAELRVRVQP